MQYYFYDTETSGLDPKWQRIMQFAGIRTDADFNEIGDPHNWLVKLTPEVLPDPEAILVTGITPQQTLQDGYDEPEFVAKLMSEVFTPGTVALGYNSIRFDDEFVRYALYRNFYDPYEREWSDDRGRWDLVDLVRMTRALRPDGIVWPVSDEGRPTNRLELISEANGIEHIDAHDALSDVRATIAVTKLLKQTQPKLFAHLSGIRTKQAVKRFLEANAGQPLVHSSSKFSSDTLGTSVVQVLGPHPTNPNAVIALDLRHSVQDFVSLSVDELTKTLFTPVKELKEKKLKRLPVKAIHLNKSPALAPLGVLDDASQERIGLTLSQIETHRKELATAGKDFATRVVNAMGDREFDSIPDVDTQLYDGFLNDSDKKLLQQARNRSQDELADWHPKFIDERLTELLLRYKAKHFPLALSQEEKQLWEQYRSKRLKGEAGPIGMQAYLNKLAKLYAETSNQNHKYLIEELQLYAESVAPYENESLL